MDAAVAERYVPNSGMDAAKSRGSFRTIRNKVQRLILQWWKEGIAVIIVVKSGTPRFVVGARQTVFVEVWFHEFLADQIGLGCPVGNLSKTYLASYKADSIYGICIRPPKKTRYGYPFGLCNEFVDLLAATIDGVIALTRQILAGRGVGSIVVVQRHLVDEKCRK